MNHDDQKSLPDENASYKIELAEVSNNTGPVQEVKELLSEYGHYMFTELGLIAGKENFFKELENFPGPAYFYPSGVFVVARIGGVAAGCVGAKRFDAESCEMKRMYTRPEHRGKGIGRLLCGYVIEWCRKVKYRRILLDTNIEMKEAVVLYRKCGFIEIEPYCINENAHPLFMEYIL